jgi:O-antigen/teichoic acid export membrane protein
VAINLSKVKIAIYIIGVTAIAQLTIVEQSFGILLSLIGLNLPFAAVKELSKDDGVYKKIIFSAIRYLFFAFSISLLLLVIVTYFTSLIFAKSLPLIIAIPVHIIVLIKLGLYSSQGQFKLLACYNVLYALVLFVSYVLGLFYWEHFEFSYLLSAIILLPFIFNDVRDSLRINYTNEVKRVLQAIIKTGLAQTICLVLFSGILLFTLSLEESSNNLTFPFIITLSIFYPAYLNTVISTVFFPQVSRSKNKLNLLWNNLYYFTLLIPALFLTSFFIEDILKILFSQDVAAYSRDFIPFIFMGFIRIWRMPISLFYHDKNSMLFIIIEFIMAAIYILSYFLGKSIGTNFWIGMLWFLALSVLMIVEVWRIFGIAKCLRLVLAHLVLFIGINFLL